MGSSHSSYSSSSSKSSPEESYCLPPNYQVLKVLGEGTFGRVVKCFDLETKRTVAVKTAKGYNSLSKEASIMRVLKEHNLDQRGIIKFYGFQLDRHLVFEVLDITLLQYICKRQTPMLLKDIRAVIQQLATAFDALKSVGVIHADVKTNNIMLVDHVRQPFKVKLIDFGLAKFKTDATLSRIRQTFPYRAPECILGLPLSEAIDMWSLGCVMAVMMLSCQLFPGETNYEVLRYFIDLMGPPPDHIIDAGINSILYFKKTDSNKWVPKTYEECYGSEACFKDKRRYQFRSLDEVKTKRLEENNVAEADERGECIELLKAMFKWDEKERITPREILAHPFITMSYLSSSSHLSSSRCRTLMSTSRFLTVPSGIIMVQTAPPKNRIPLEETPDETPVSESDTDSDCTPAAAPATALKNINNPGNIEDSEPRKKKKKKNCIKRFFSWFKKNVCSCDNVICVAE